MAVTPQTNTTLEEIAAKLVEYDSFAVCGHVNPDGDCLGSQLALALALEALGKKVDRILVRDDAIDAGLRFLPGADRLVAAEHYMGQPEAFFACDVPLRSRIERASEIQDRVKVRFTVDHHAVDGSMADFNYVDPDAPACGLLIWELIGHLGVDITPDMATCCYVALMTDTGRFQYQNTDAAAFSAACDMVAAGASPALCSREVYQRRSLASLQLERIMLDHMAVSTDGSWAFSYLSAQDYASCGAVKADAEPLVDVLRSIDGVRAACIVREHAENVRGSLRAKDDDTDVSVLARFIGGGGHKAAAGFTFDAPLEEVLSVMPRYLDCLCSFGGCASEAAVLEALSEIRDSGRV